MSKIPRVVRKVEDMIHEISVSPLWAVVYLGDEEYRTIQYSEKALRYINVEERLEGGPPKIYGREMVRVSKSTYFRVA